MLIAFVIHRVVLDFKEYVFFLPYFSIWMFLVFKTSFALDLMGYGLMGLTTLQP